MYLEVKGQPWRLKGQPWRLQGNLEGQRSTLGEDEGVVTSSLPVWRAETETWRIRMSELANNKIRHEHTVR